MKKSSLIFLAIAGAAATSALTYYILHNSKVTEIEKPKDLEKLTKDAMDKAKDTIDDISDKAQDVMDNVKDKAEELKDQVVEDVREVKEHTEEIISTVVDNMKASMNYDVKPYEISHETYLASEPPFKKVSIFYDAENDIFTTFYKEPVKEFVLGKDNIEEFLVRGLFPMYIRNEKLSCDYALYKGEEDDREN